MKSNTDFTLLKERFERRIAHEPNTGCWLWEGATDSAHGYGTGYGRMKINERLTRCNRISMFLYKGGDIYDGRIVCHTCDVSLCVNPEHLYYGTPKDNYHDMKSRGRYKPLLGSKHQNSKLNEIQVRIIREARKVGFSRPQIAEYFRIERATIHAIDSGRTWRHLK